MLALFAATLFASATLLFLVQPMVGKLILPRLGGTPAVWNTCMVFFQAVLLIGYAYTHTLSTTQGRRRQIIIQSLILLFPLLFLPFSLGTWTPPAEQNPIFSVLWLLLGMVGLPFFVVSTTAPLLQRWFAGTSHPSAKDPYFLYGASNLGSMLALLLYPVVVEPLFPVETQAQVWTAGYLLFAGLVVACGLAVWGREPASSLALEPIPAAVASTDAAALSAAITAQPRRKHSFAIATPKAAVTVEARTDPTLAPLTPWRRLRWVALAAVPSSMMLGMTTYMTTDIAAIPFFWVLPLALYLLTFILVFARWPMIWTDAPHSVVLYLQPFFLMLLVLVLLAHAALGVSAIFAIHGIAFFLTALMCHGELARDRPEPSHLTEFYLWLSVGGVVGGLFNGLLAPLVFRTGNIEYPAAMVMACLLRPRMVGKDTLVPGDTNQYETTGLGRVLDLAIPLVLAGLGLLAAWYGELVSRRSVFMAVPVILTLALLCRPLRFGLALACLFSVVALYERRQTPFIFQDRGFFGFVKVRKDVYPYTNSEGEVVKTEVYHTLVHGGINHGMQIMDPSRRREPITYFHPKSGIGQVFELFSGVDKGESKRNVDLRLTDVRLAAALVGMGPSPFDALPHLKSERPFAVVGLGIGTLAAHARPTQPLHFYEIDPLIRRLSIPRRDDEEPLFYYVNDALLRGAEVDIIMGDGRLMIEREAAEGYYHIIVLDAFSSDAIPVHLLTAEAIDLYLSKLAPGGVLIFNATNRYVMIHTVLADLAVSRGLDCFWYSDDVGRDATPDRYDSDWIVLQRRDAGAKLEGKTRLATGLPPLSKTLAETWREIDPPGNRLWTDGYSNLLSVIHWR